MGLWFQNNVTTSCGDKIDPRRAAVGSPVSEEDFLSVLGQIKPHQLRSNLNRQRRRMAVPRSYNPPASNQRPPLALLSMLCNALFCTGLLCA